MDTYEYMTRRNCVGYRLSTNMAWHSEENIAEELKDRKFTPVYIPPCTHPDDFKKGERTPEKWKYVD